MNPLETLKLMVKISVPYFIKPAHLTHVLFVAERLFEGQSNVAKLLEVQADVLCVLKALIE